MNGLKEKRLFFYVLAVKKNLKGIFFIYLTPSS